MNGYELVTYIPEHFKEASFTPQDGAAFFGINPIEVAKDYYFKGPAYTAFHNERIIAMAGVFLVWRGFGEAWALFGPDSERHKFYLHKTSLFILQFVADRHKLQRIQAVVEQDFEKGMRWMDALGFSCEGMMPKYFDGKTFIRYAKLF